MASAIIGLASELASLRNKDFIESADLTTNQIQALFELAHQLKSGKRRIDLGNRVLGLIF